MVSHRFLFKKGYVYDKYNLLSWAYNYKQIMKNYFNLWF